MPKSSDFSRSQKPALREQTLLYLWGSGKLVPLRRDNLTRLANPIAIWASLNETKSESLADSFGERDKACCAFNELFDNGFDDDLFGGLVEAFLVRIQELDIQFEMRSCRYLHEMLN